MRQVDRETVTVIYCCGHRECTDIWDSVTRCSTTDECMDSKWKFNGCES